MSEVPGRVIGEGHGNPLVFLPGVSHGQRSLVGYSPQGHGDQARLSTLTHTLSVVIGRPEEESPGLVNSRLSNVV